MPLPKRKSALSDSYQPKLRYHHYRKKIDINTFRCCVKTANCQQPCHRATRCFRLASCFYRKPHAKCGNKLSYAVEGGFYACFQRLSLPYAAPPNSALKHELQTVVQREGVLPISPISFGARSSQNSLHFLQAWTGMTVSRQFQTPNS